MARTTKFNKDDILEKTKEFIKENGFESLNARSLCKYIGCSTQPLFKNFENMEGLNKELKTYLHDYYDDFINKIVDENDYLYTISYAYALFAYKEPNIFKALFMSKLAGSRTIDEVLHASHNIGTIKASTKQYNMSLSEAENLYRDVRFFTHGLSCQIACNSIKVTNEEIKKLIKNLINNLKEVK